MSNALRERISKRFDPVAPPCATTLAFVFSALVSLAVVVRIPLFPYLSFDVEQYVAPWIETFRRDGLSAIGTDFSNYSPAYLYWLWLGSLTPLSNLAVTKVISFFFDVLLASAAAWFVRDRSVDWRLPVAAFALVLFGPTVILNSAAWGQCDAGYAVCTVVGLVLLGRRRFTLCMLALGAGIAFKQQTVFVLPLLALYSFRGIVPWKQWVVLPLPYLVSIVIPALYGRPLDELLLIYWDQSQQYPLPTLNAPTLYAWLGFTTAFTRSGVLFGAVVVLVAIFIHRRWEAAPDNDRLIAIAAFFLVLTPFVLPRMHERYFYMADVVTIIYFVLRPGRWYIAVLVNLASLLSYSEFLRHKQVVPLEVSAAIMAAALFALAWDVFPMTRSKLAARFLPSERLPGG